MKEICQNCKYYTPHNKWCNCRETIISDPHLSCENFKRRINWSLKDHILSNFMYPITDETVRGDKATLGIVKWLQKQTVYKVLKNDSPSFMVVDVIFSTELLKNTTINANIKIHKMQSHSTFSSIKLSRKVEISFNILNINSAPQKHNCSFSLEITKTMNYKRIIKEINNIYVTEWKK